MTQNQSYSFDNYVTGKANAFAHHLAKQLFKPDHNAYSPLFIYGGAGVGKTHLVNAVANQFRRENEGAKIKCIHATHYISEVVRAFQTKNFQQMKELYYSLDLLIIDDIDFIADKPGTQQELLLTLESLADLSKNIVITCNVPLNEIVGIDSRLASRFSAGVAASIKRPNLQMRISILLNMAASMNLMLDEDVAYFVAKKFKSNIRELGGAIKSVDAFARYHKRPVSLRLVKEAIKDALPK